MNKAFELILERLEELQNNLLSQTEGDINVQVGIINGVMYSKKIVQEVAEEYKCGWIPCSKSLPTEKDGIVLICDENGKVRTGIYSEHSKIWIKGDMYSVGGADVIAWQQLPEPYKDGDNNA